MWTVIIAGGRDADESEALAILDRDLQPKAVAEVFSGGARGWDAAGEAWAAKHGIPVRRFPADWPRGRRAGPERNEVMVAAAAATLRGALDYGPGGRGTADVVRRALAHGLRVRALPLPRRPENRKDQDR